MGCRALTVTDSSLEAAINCQGKGCDEAECVHASCGKQRSDREINSLRFSDSRYAREGNVVNAGKRAQRVCQILQIMGYCPLRLLANVFG